MAEETKPGIELPEDLTTLDDAQLQKLSDKIAARFVKLNEKERISADDLKELTALADQFDLVKAESGTRTAAQEEAQAAREALAQRMSGATETEDEAAEETEDEAAVEGDAETVGDIIEVPDDASEITEKESVAASAAPAKRTVGKAKTAPRPAPSTKVRPTPGGNTSIVASSDIPGVPTGKELNRTELGEALHARARNMGDSKGARTRGMVASINVTNAPNDIRNTRDDEGIRSAWSKAHDTGSLVASGGWCAPSETIYDFVCDFEAMPETLDLPTLTANRGGLRYPISPLLGDVFDDINSGFTWTEANDIAAALPGGPTKPCFVIPCPDFDETRLQAQGICVTAGNLTDRAYPELTSRYIDLVMTAHAHRMNALRIDRVVAGSTPVAPTVVDLSATEAILAGIELQFACLRDEFFMGADQTFEVVLPRWTRTVIRRDLARRAGVEFNQITNGDITSFFSEIGGAVQFVSNWQSLRGVATPGCIVLPASVNALIYPAGAHTLLDGGSLDLGVVRDSTLNATNDYTAAWTEEFWAVVSRCVSLNVTIPICADGSTGAPQVIACPTA